MVRLSALVQSPVLGSQLQRDTDVLERFQQKSMMILEGLGARVCGNGERVGIIQT